VLLFHYLHIRNVVINLNNNDLMSQCGPFMAYMYTEPVINVFNLEYLPHCHYREHVDMELMPVAICQTLLRINNSSQGAIYITPSLSANIRHKPHHVNRARTVSS